MGSVEGTRRIGANPEKSVSKFPGSGLKKNLVNSVLCCFPEKNRQNAPKNPGLVNQFSATPRGQLNWTGPIADGSDRNYYEMKLFSSLGNKIEHKPFFIKLFGRLRDIPANPGISRQKKFDYPGFGGQAVFIRNQEKGVLAKGVSAEPSPEPKRTKNTQGYWT